MVKTCLNANLDGILDTTVAYQNLSNNILNNYIYKNIEKFGFFLSTILGKFPSVINVWLTAGKKKESK